jgi:hypothetical protein
MSNESESTNPLDPFETMNAMWEANLKNWKSMRDTSMESWSKIMIDMVNSDEYSQATGQWLDTYLTMSQPMKRIIDMTMTQVLTGLNMPMRSDVTSLAERLTNIEMRMDDQDAKLDDILHTIQALSASYHATDVPATTHTGSNNGDNGAHAPGKTHAAKMKAKNTGVSSTSQANAAQHKAKGEN